MTPDRVKGGKGGRCHGSTGPACPDCVIAKLIYDHSKVLDRVSNVMVDPTAVDRAIDQLNTCGCIESPNVTNP